MKENITEENLINLMIHASNTFCQVEFLLYYSKLKSLWNNQDATTYHVIDLGNKEILTQVHELLDKNELKLLYNRLVLDNENMYIGEKLYKYLELFDQIIEKEKNENLKDDKVMDEVADNELVDKNSEKTKKKVKNFNESIAKMKKIVRQLDGLSEKYHYLSNTSSIPA